MATTKTGTAIDASGSSIDVTVTALSNGSLADANDVMATLNDIETDLEGHMHSLDLKVGYDSMIASYRPPDTGDSSDRWRMVCGSKSVTIVDGQNKSPNVLVYFDDESDQGDPSFTTAPRVVLTATDAQSHYGYCVQTDAVATTGFSFYVFELDGGSHGEALDIHWTAYGKVA